jgi:3-phenylpropionate/trans-cinnamate dioxygenase ferredoxin reductase subunit
MVIIGAGMAGARGVINLRANGYEDSITLIGDEPHLPYDRPPLSKSAITSAGDPSPVWLLDDGIVASLKADVRKAVAALSINRAAKSVELSDGSSIAYDKLLIATGAKPRRLSLPGGENALLLRNIEDTIALRKQFLPGKNIVVIGGGFIGLELASSAATRGCQVTLVEAQPRILMRGVPEEIARIVHDRHVAAGVAMRVGTKIKSLSATSVELTDGTLLAADAIVAGIGAAPETRLAEAAGLAIDNGIACDEFMRTSDADIFAAGDCCSFINTRFDRQRLRLEAWRSAQEQAAIAAENMLGGQKANATVPWFWSDQYDLSLQVSGMPELGPVTVSRRTAPDSLVLFHLAEDGTLMGASGIGVGNSIGRDVKLAEMMIARSMKPLAGSLADPAIQLKNLLRG